jgi:hypothetical protein
MYFKVQKYDVSPLIFLEQIKVQFFSVGRYIEVIPSEYKDFRFFFVLIYERLHARCPECHLPKRKVFNYRHCNSMNELIFLALIEQSSYSAMLNIVESVPPYTSIPSIPGIPEFVETGIGGNS